MLISTSEISASFGSLLAFMGLPMGMEWVVLLVLGLLIFGKRLPEVGRSLGKGIVEFKKGIRGLEDEIEDESSLKSSSKRISDSSVSRQELPRTDSREEQRTPASSHEDR